MFNGLVKYNIKQNKAFAYPKYEKNDGYLNLTLIDNTIWSGATGFFAKINGDKIKFFEPPGFNDVTEVHSFFQYNNSDSIFIGTDMGIYLYHNNSVKRYLNSTIGKNKKVKLLKKDKENIWVLVDGQGIYVLNIPANMFIPIKTKENCTEDFTGIHGFIDVDNNLIKRLRSIIKEVEHIRVKEVFNDDRLRNNDRFSVIMKEVDEMDYKNLFIDENNSIHVMINDSEGFGFFGNM
jgi:ligand-binding sensor domain-containing protein